jgi:thioester reductase-like protein
VDSIYHGGAVVDFVQPYELLKEANVQGTQEVIRLAHKARARALNLVSTVAVFDTLDQRGLAKAMEDAMPDGRSGFRNGYAHSKWAAEGLVRKAAERGLPVRVFRPGIVSGHSHTGHWQLDMVALMLKSFASTGAAIEPVAGGTLNAAPVDYVAAAIVQLAQQPRTLGQTFHLTNPAPTPWSDIYLWMNRFGYSVEALPYPMWLQRLQEAAQRDPAVKAHAPYFTARPEAWQLRQPPFDVSRAQEGLRGSRVACPALTEAQLGVYLRHFIETGFMLPPGLPPQAGGPSDGRAAAQARG